MALPLQSWAHMGLRGNQVAARLSDKGLISRSLSSQKDSNLVKTKRSFEDRRQTEIARPHEENTVNAIMPIMQKRQRVYLMLSAKKLKELHRMIDKLHVAADAIDNEFVKKFKIVLIPQQRIGHFLCSRYPDALVW